MEIKKVKTSDLKFDRELVKIEHSVSVETPVIVDREMNVIFGDASAMKKTEVEVIVTDLPFKETRLAIHSIGRWAEPNWTKLKAEDASKYGYTAFIDGFIFEEAPKKVDASRLLHENKDEILGNLF